jgi:hypothetical protein
MRSSEKPASLWDSPTKLVNNWPSRRLAELLLSAWSPDAG